MPCFVALDVRSPCRGIFPSETSCHFLKCRFWKFFIFFVLSIVYVRLFAPDKKRFNLLVCLSQLDLYSITRTDLIEPSSSNLNVVYMASSRLFPNGFEKYRIFLFVDT